MLVIHTVAACRRCRGTTMWRLDKGNGHCDRCHRKKCVPRRRPSPVHLGALFGLLVIVYVKPVTRLTPLYMALIDPFRRFIVYPAIGRRIQRDWLRAYA